MLINIVGNVGSGKTLLAVMLSLNFAQKRQLAIHSNFTFKKIPYHKLSIPDLIGQKITNAIVILDEAYNYIHARNSMSNGNQMFASVLFQSRKTDLILILTEQIQRSIDIYYRELTDLTIKCENHVTYFEYNFLFHKLGQHYTLRLSYDFASKFFAYYNTKELIIEDNEKNKALMFSAMSVEQKESYIVELAQKVIDYSDKDVEKITKSDIKRYCMLHGIKSMLTDSIYDAVKKLCESIE